MAAYRYVHGEGLYTAESTQYNTAIIRVSVNNFLWFLQVYITYIPTTLNYRPTYETNIVTSNHNLSL